MAAATGLVIEANNGLFAPVFIVFLLALALDRTVIARILSWKWLVLLGEASFAVLILQFPVHVLFERWLTPEAMLTNAPFFYGYLVTLTGLAILVFKFVEQPARNWIQQYMARPKILLQRDHL